MKRVTLILIICIYQQNFAQSVCVSDETSNFEDLNEIAIKKCGIENSKKEKNTTENRLNGRAFKRRRNLNKSFKSKDKIANIISSISKTKSVISFQEVEKTPLFPLSKVDETSFNEKMIGHIKSNLIYPKKALINKLEAIVFVSFVINTNGNIENVEVSSKSSNCDILKKEAIRIISLLPKFTPGKQEGKEVRVSYNFEMDFSLS